MYKNTVPKQEAELPTAVRVRGAGETDQQAAQEAARLAQQGVKTLVFPDAEMVRVWRARIAALA